MEGGHGQWFVQSFAADLAPRGALQSLYPDAAVELDDALVVGNRAEAFVARRGAGRALAVLPDARSFARLPPAALRSAERRVGKECGSTCNSRRSPHH